MYSKSSMIVKKKQQGQYFTDPIVTKHIVSEICDIILSDCFWTPLMNLKRSRKFNSIQNLLTNLFQLRFVDPAMGDGVFLYEVLLYFNKFFVELVNYTYSTPFYTIVRSYFQNKFNVDISNIKKKDGKSLDILNLHLIRTMIYGVDLDMEIVIRAHDNILKLFCTPEIKNIAKNCLKLNLKQGNSLISPVKLDKKSILNINEIKSSEIKQLLSIRKTIQNKTWNEISGSDIDKLLKVSEKIIHNCIIDFLKIDPLFSNFIHLKEKSIEKGIFCWPIEFPEVFLNNKYGFDVVLGNPPWEKWKLYNREWLGTTAITKQNYIQEVNEKRKNNPSANEEYIKLKDFYQKSSKYFSSYFKYQPGEKNLFKIFLELFFNICREKGHFVIIIPGGFLGEFYCQPLRYLLLTESNIILLIELISNNEIFPEVEPGLSILVFFAKKDKSGSNFPFIKGIRSIKDFQNIKTEESPTKLSNTVYLSSKDIIEKSPRNIIPAIKNQGELRVTEKIMVYDSLSSSIWGCKTSRGLDMTIDKNMLTTIHTKYPLIEGRHLVRLGYDNSLPRYWIENFDLYKRKVPFWNQKIIVWKNFSGNHRRRRMRIAILPPMSVVSNSVICLYNLPDIKEIEYYLAGMMCSIPFEFRIRQICYGLNINQYIIDSMTVPFFKKNDLFHKQMVDTVKKFVPFGSEWARRKMEASSPLEKACLEKDYQENITRIDSLAALVYNLTRNEFELTLKAHPQLESSYIYQALMDYDKYIN